MAISRKELPDFAAFTGPEILEKDTMDILWNLCQMCWDHDPDRRPAMNLILDKLYEQLVSRHLLHLIDHDNMNADPREDSQQPFTVPDVSSVTIELAGVGGADGLHLGDDGNNKEGTLNFHPLPLSTDTQWQDSMKVEAMDPSQALKKTSNNPIVDTQPGASTSGPEPIQKEAKVIRSPLLSLPEETLFTTMDEFVPISDEDLMKSLALEGESVDMSSAFDMVFSDLQPFSMIDLANSDIIGGSFDGKKKGDRKADKDDPTKRTEETTHMRPKSPVVNDVDGPTVVTLVENTCSKPQLFPLANFSLFNLFTGLFEGRKISMPFLPPLTLQNFSKIPRSNVRPQEIPWSQAEENALKRLTDHYPSSWRLIADALNSSRIRTSIDLRTPQECFETWKSKCALSHHIDADTPPPQTPSMPATTHRMITRSTKRLATAAQNDTGMATVEARKSSRRSFIYDAVCKSSARRQKGMSNTAICNKPT